jgi:hypothetical protein
MQCKHLIEEEKAQTEQGDQTGRILLFGCMLTWGNFFLPKLIKQAKIISYYINIKNMFWFWQQQAGKHFWRVFLEVIWVTLAVKDKHTGMEMRVGVWRGDSVANSKRRVGTHSGWPDFFSVKNYPNSSPRNAYLQSQLEHIGNFCHEK